MSNNTKDPVFPKFLLADIYENIEDIYIIHTEYPSFILNNETKEIKFFHYMPKDELESTEIKRLIDNALAWVDLELDKYDEKDLLDNFPWEK